MRPNTLTSDQFSAHRDWDVKWTSQAKPGFITRRSTAGKHTAAAAALHPVSPEVA